MFNLLDEDGEVDGMNIGTRLFIGSVETTAGKKLQVSWSENIDEAIKISILREGDRVPKVIFVGRY